MNVRTDCVGRTRQIYHHFTLCSGRSAINIVEDDVGDIYLRRVRSTLGSNHVEIALVQYYRVIGVLDVDIAIGDVVDAPITYILTRLCL